MVDSPDLDLDSPERFTYEEPIFNKNKPKSKTPSPAFQK
jgi:hypothetical protein